LENLTKIPKTKLIFGTDVIRDYSLLTKLAGKKVFTFPDSLLRKSLLDSVIYFDEYKTYKGKVIGFVFDNKSFEILMNSGMVIHTSTIVLASEIKEYLQNDIELLFKGIKKDFRKEPMNKTITEVPEKPEEEDWQIVDDNFI